MSEPLRGVPAVTVTRGARVESLHDVAACVAEPSGRVVVALGDVETPVYLRSAAKPFIAAAAVRAGVVERFGFGDRELAVMSASHNGEPGHVEAVAGMLASIGASAHDLACGAHAPAYEPAAAALLAAGEAPTALHNNCSGKHAGILALARALDAPLSGYLEPEHPAQRAILDLCERVSDDRFGPDRLATDGCGIPVYATPLRSAATGFARLATLERLDDDDARALARVAAAIAAEPWFLAGTGRFDTDLVRATGGRIIGKAGAEGVHGDALLDLGLGLALKVVDGTRRAVPPAAIALLDALHALDDGALSALAEHARVPVRNVAGKAVGLIVARAGFPGRAERQPSPA